MMLGVTAARVQPHAVEADVPTLHWELEPWHRAFFRNLGDFLLRREPPPVEITAKPAPLRQNYFIRTGVDATRFVESYSYHIVLITAIYLFCTLPFFNRAPKLRSPFDNTQVQYVPLSEYLPPINTAAKAHMKPRKGAPKLAQQEILSVPPNADNTQQTLVTPPKIKLEHDVSLPNIVAWTPIPAAQPVSASARPVSQLRVPQLEPDVVAPAADTSQLKLKAPRLEADVAAPSADVSQLKAKLQLPNLQPSVVDPPLSQNQLKLKSGDINMAQLEPQVAAPKLPVEAQRASGAGDAAKGGGSSDKVAPAPDLQGVRPGQGQGQIIALGLNPDVHGPISVPAGNRRGEFHASPSGKADAPGSPNVTGTGTADQGGGHGINNGVPPGIVVGAPPPGAATAAVAGTPNGSPSKSVANPDLEARKRILAAAMKPSLPNVRERPAPPPPPALTDDPAASIEQRVFGPKRYYLMIMNMPNLASASGSWIIRYAELQQSEDQGPLAAPVATFKVDPAYAPDALRDRVEGTVTLYAIIRPDGSVDGIRVLDSLDSRLDANAVRALAGWHFRPGTKNGTPVAVEAVVQIPFHLTRLR
jgi:TonB family protein